MKPIRRTLQHAAAERVALRRWLREHGIEASAECSLAGTIELMHQVAAAGGCARAVMRVAVLRVEAEPCV